MKENWTIDMKQKLEEHKMAPPAGLWEGISSEMGLQQEPVPKTVAIKHWHWVAAMVVALAGFFLVYQFSQDGPLPQVAHKSQKQEVPTMKEANPENQPLALVDTPHRVQTKVPPKAPIEESQPTPAETVQEITKENSQHEVDSTAISSKESEVKSKKEDDLNNSNSIFDDSKEEEKKVESVEKKLFLKQKRKSPSSIDSIENSLIMPLFADNGFSGNESKKNSKYEHKKEKEKEKGKEKEKEKEKEGITPKTSNLVEKKFNHIINKGKDFISSLNEPKFIEYLR